jgi:flagellar hook-length control protein FliK
LKPVSGTPDAVATPVPDPSSGVAGATPAAAPTTVMLSGAGIQPGTTVIGPAATAPAPSIPTAAGAAGVVTVPAATTDVSPVAAAPLASPLASGADTSAASPAGPAVAASDDAPVLTGPVRQTGASGRQPSEAPLAVKFAGSAQPAPAATSAAAATVAAAKAGETLVPAQPGPIARTAAVKVTPTAIGRAAAMAPAAAAADRATPAVTPRSGSRASVRLASMNAVQPKAEAMAIQAVAQTATQIAPPFAPTMMAEAPTASAAVASGPVPATAPEAMIERQLDLAADGEWLDQLARDIAGAGGTEGKMRFRLDPEHLGTLRVELAQSERGTSVRLTVDSEAARAIIAEAQPKLAAEARAQGVRIAETHVDLAGGHAGDPRRQEAERRDPQLRTARESSSPAEPERQTRSSSDRYA